MYGSGGNLEVFLIYWTAAKVSTSLPHVADNCWAVHACATRLQATDIVWKLLVCITLFTLANFLKSFVTKLLSTHFYRTAHFRKVKDAM
jgi:hypothetical protein